MIHFGLVDFDSSHSIEYTQRFNHVGVDRDQYVEGGTVTHGWPGSSEMAPERIPGFLTQIEQAGVKIVNSPEEMIGQVDAILVLSLCGSVHWDRAKPFLEAGIPVYIDKPFACSLSDAEKMIQASQENNTTLYHASALMFAEEIQELQNQSSMYGKLHGVFSYGPAKRTDQNPGLFHYGIHPTSILFALMGEGCQEVSVTWTEDSEVVTGRWKDGRLGTLRGNRVGNTSYGVTAFYDAGVLQKTISTRYAYRELCQSIVNSVQANQPAVSHQLNLEMTRFVLAALESEKQNGQVVSLDSVG